MGNQNLGHGDCGLILLIIYWPMSIWRWSNLCELVERGEGPVDRVNLQDWVAYDWYRTKSSQTQLSLSLSFELDDKFTYLDTQDGRPFLLKPRTEYAPQSLLFYLFSSIARFAIYSRDSYSIRIDTHTLSFKENFFFSFFPIASPVKRVKCHWENHKRRNYCDHSYTMKICNKWTPPFELV